MVFPQALLHNLWLWSLGQLYEIVFNVVKAIVFVAYFELLLEGTFILESMQTHKDAHGNVDS